MAKLTVVIPTRERADTLKYTLQTLVQQDFLDCVFLISDNFSSDETLKTVQCFDDPRIQYINTGQRLSMSDNWEFALKQVRSEYVTFIGDDDGFLPFALSNAFSLIERFNLDCLTWKKAEYCWPNHVDFHYQNSFAVQVGPAHLFWMSTRKKLSHVLNFNDCYSRLPCLYNSIISLQRVQQIISRTDNRRFFNGISPDVYSGLVLSQVIEKYLISDYPYSVNGASGHSNGTSFTRKFTDGTENPYSLFTGENRVKYDERLLVAPAVQTCVAGELLLARKHLVQSNFPAINWARYCKVLMSASQNSQFENEIIASARHTNSQMNLRLALNPKGGKFRGPAEVAGFGYSEHTLRMVLSPTQVSNIFDACLLIYAISPNHGSVQFSGFLRRFWNIFRNEVKVELKRLVRGC